MNIPAFRLYVVDGDRTAAHPALRMNVVIGRAEQRRLTPVFVGTMREVVFRPYWDVPSSIAQREEVPGLRRDPGYAASQRFEIVSGGEGAARVYAMTDANLDRVASGSLRRRHGGWRNPAPERSVFAPPSPAPVMPPLDITRIVLPTIVGVLALGACSQTPSPTLEPTHSESTVMVTNAPTASSPQSSSTFRYNTDIGAAETSLDVPLDNAWARVTRAYDVLKIPITDNDAAHRLVGARRALVRDRLAGQRMSHWFSCGETAMGTPRADAYAVYVTALTQLVPATGGNTGYLARTVVSAFANAVDASSNSVQCTSTGALEQKLSDEFTRGLMPGTE